MYLTLGTNIFLLVIIFENEDGCEIANSRAGEGIRSIASLCSCLYLVTHGNRTYMEKTRSL